MSLPMSQNKIALLLAILTPEILLLDEKATEASARVEELESELYDLKNRNGELESSLGDYKRHVRRLEDEVNQNSSRKLEDLESIRNYWKGMYDSLKASDDAEASSVEVMTPKLISYIFNGGLVEWERGRKIECIKGVRDITRWSLKEAKDFVESFDWKNLPEAGNSSGDTIRNMILAAAPASYTMAVQQWASKQIADKLNAG